MQDKSFEDALRELKDRLAGEIVQHVEARLHAMTRNTVSSLVTDIESPPIRKSVTDILCMVKVLSLINTLASMDLLTDAEWQELKDYITQLHAQARQADQQTP